MKDDDNETNESELSRIVTLMKTGKTKGVPFDAFYGAMQKLISNNIKEGKKNRSLDICFCMVNLLTNINCIIQTTMPTCCSVILFYVKVRLHSLII